MKPLSPVLFLTAVQAVALRSKGGCDPDTCTLDFIQEMGRISHLDESWTSSSWPFTDVRTLGGLIKAAFRMRMLRRVPVPGDIVVVKRSRVGVILDVLEYGIGSGVTTARCRIALAQPAEAGHPAQVGIEVLWCGHGEGDLFIRWYEVAFHVRRAA